MKKKFKQIKWSCVGWIVSGLVVFYFCVAAVDYKYSLPLSGIDIHVNNGTGLLFVDDSDIQQMITDMGIRTKQNILAQVNCNKMERALEQNSYIQNAEVYIDALGVLHVEIAQRVPLIRIINSNAVSFYLDEQGKKMPLSPKFTARVAVANGVIQAGESQADTTGNKTLKKIYALADFVSRDSFLLRLTDEIWVDDKGEFHLVPKVAGQEVLVGDVNCLKEKFGRLKAFYQLTFNTNCADYKLINLKYKNEIFVTRRDGTTPIALKQETTTATDTTKNKNRI